MRAGQSVCVRCQEGPVGYGGPTPATEADLALSLLYASKALSLPVLDSVVFLGDSDA